MTTIRKNAKTDRRRYLQSSLANQESPCILSRCKHCQRALWCHDKVRLIASIRERQETPEARERRSNARLQRAQVVLAERGRAIPSASFSVRALRKQIRGSSSRGRFATDPMPEVPFRPLLLLGLSPLRLLEAEQFLWRCRCWLLRTFVCPCLSFVKKEKVRS